MNVRMFRVVSIAVGVSLGAFSLQAGGGLTPIPETEPNNTPATADPLPSLATLQSASGAITAGDADYYSFTATAGSRLWTLVDTGAAPAGFRDSILTLFGPDGVTQIELDDDDGTGTDCDGAVDNLLSSAIAGRTLVAGGTYYLRVSGFDSLSTVSSYRLLAVVSTAADTEVEPNGTTATANLIASAGAPIGVRNAAIGIVGDVNYYSVTAPAGSTIFISADGDPERNGGTDLVVDLIQPDGTTLILSVDSSDNSGFPPPPAESFCFNVTTAGTYYVRVSGFNSTTKMTTGTYSLAVALGGLPVTPTPTATASPTATLTATVTSTPIVGGASPTPTPTLAAVTATATATATATFAASSTPIGGIVPSNIPTLSFPMLLVMALGLLSAGFVLIRRS